MISNIRTLQDYQTNQQNNTTQTNIDSITEGYSLDIGLRNQAATRLALNDYTLPYIEQYNIITITDRTEVLRLNDVLSTLEIQSILESIINRTHNPFLINN